MVVFEHAAAGKQSEVRIRRSMTDIRLALEVIPQLQQGLKCVREAAVVFVAAVLEFGGCLSGATTVAATVLVSC